jgi:hypothetical protein
MRQGKAKAAKSPTEAKYDSKNISRHFTAPLECYCQPSALSKLEVKHLKPTVTADSHSITVMIEFKLYYNMGIWTVLRLQKQASWRGNRHMEYKAQSSSTLELKYNQKKLAATERKSGVTSTFVRHTSTVCIQHASDILLLVLHTSFHGVPRSAIGNAFMHVELFIIHHITWLVRFGHCCMFKRVALSQMSTVSRINN